MGPTKFLAVVFGVVVFYLFARVWIGPLKWLGRLARNAGIGFAALWGWNLIFLSMGWAIGINLITVLTIALLGWPGFALLLALKTWVG